MAFTTTVQKPNYSPLVSVDETKSFRPQIDNYKQDQTTPWNDFYFLQQIGTTTLTSDLSVGDRTIDVTSVADISVGDTIGLLCTNCNRYMFTEVISIATLTVTLASLVDYPFEAANTIVLSSTKDMNVDGSVTPQVFAVQSGQGLSIDITRILMVCFTATAVDFSKFGDIAGGLTYPIYLRAKENGTFRNKVNIYDNGDLAAIAYDWNPLAATNPVQGQDGFTWRFTLNGDDKHGVTQRVLGQVNTLQWVIQDDLTSLTKLHSIVAIHEVD